MVVMLALLVWSIGVEEPVGPPGPNGYFATTATPWLFSSTILGVVFDRQYETASFLGNPSLRVSIVSLQEGEDGKWRGGRVCVCVCVCRRGGKSMRNADEYHPRRRRNSECNAFMKEEGRKKGSMRNGIADCGPFRVCMVCVCVSCITNYPVHMPLPSLCLLKVEKVVEN